MDAVVTPEDPSFPAALRPEAIARFYKKEDARSFGPLHVGLHVRGAWPPPPGIAIVGTREPSPHALTLARTMAQGLVAAGWAVWSGGARGIDRAAHEGALLAGGRTVVACPSGLDAPYPPEHAALFDEIARSGGTLITSVPAAATPRAYLFHRRNALLAALTVATVLVEGGRDSGARSTCAAARACGKPVLAVPHAPWDERGLGAVDELMLGARPIVRADDVIAIVGVGPFASEPRARAREDAGAHAPRVHVDSRAREVIAPAHTREETAPQTNTKSARIQAILPRAYATDDVVRRVWDALGHDAPSHVDDVCGRASLPVSAAVGALLTLTLETVVVEGPAGFYKRAEIRPSS